MEHRREKSNAGDGALRKQIDENLRQLYDDTLNEPLPERFTHLLAQLKQRPQETRNDD